jgi:glycosyltransferase involved in cell wall biosynthesis
VKVLFISNLFPNSAEPARGIFNFHQLRHFARHCEVQAIAPLTRLPDIPSVEQIGGITVQHPRQYYLPKIGRPLNPYLFALSVRQTVLNLRTTFLFDVIFANWAYPDACGVENIASQLKIPFVASISGSDANVYLNYKIRRRQILRMLDRAHSVTVRSQVLKTLLTGHGVPADKVHVLYNGVDPKLFYPTERATARRQLHLPEIDKVLIYVGRLSP